ncbi:MAG TPA: SpoIIE family protein phosphatase [Bacteroidales bacterium]|nr:SpoIIE family protein phosphatase [Bacteroidales bacterium]HOK98353.1 SpoIIE family protein phosphatase [Bacteroidales bacterium]HPO65220.1 SpoIIE family protein phosphatase [Bacteroidales bacterium]
MSILRYIALLIVGFSLMSTLNAQNDFEVLADGYREQGKLTQAAEYYNKAGYAYWNRGQKQQAAVVFEKALAIFEQAGNGVACLTLNNNLGLIYSETEKFQQAERAFLNALRYARLLKNTSEIYNALVNLANVEIDMENYSFAVQHAREALNIALEQNNLKNIAKCYSLLAESYEKMGDSKNAFRYFELYSATDKKIKQQEMELVKSMSAEEVNKAQLAKRMTEIELKIKKGELKLTQDSLFVTEKIALQRQMEIAQKTAQLEQKELQLRYEKNIRRLITGGFFIVIAFLVVLAYMLLRIKRQKEEILQQRNELNLKNRNITDSIFYGQRIQNAMLPDMNKLQEEFNTSLLFWPKDIVSGDFYWHHQVTVNQLQYHFFAVVDCTGHGVPGAFMSMIGNRLLNEIIGLRNKIQPAEILYHLNLLLISELHQPAMHTIDGMDIALCRILKVDDSHYELVFAGAKRPIIVFQHQSKETKIIEGDIISIGNLKQKNPKSYSEKHLLLSSNDTIVMYTDGLTDQPNPQRSKFGTPRLLNIANECLTNSLDSFMVHLQNSLESFKQNEPQRDDITVLAVGLK